MKSYRALLAALLAAGLAAAPVSGSAHHSFAMYDQAHPVILRGAVKVFQWTNPHVILFVLAAPAAGGPEETWALEITSPGNLTRIGWTRHSLKPGDKVEIEASPLRDGQKGGALKKVTLLDSGQTLTANWLKPGG